MRSFWISGLMIAAFLAASSSTAWAWSFGKPKASKTDAAKPAAAGSTAAPAVEAAKAAPAPPAVSKSQMDKQRAVREKKRAELNNTEWDITVAELSGKGTPQKDVLTFADNKFSSKAYSGLGFGVSNYTISVADDGGAVVETMQSSEKEGMVFWRVELDAASSTAKGIISRQLAPNKTEDYSFASTAKRPIVKAASATAPAAAQ